MVQYEHMKRDVVACAFVFVPNFLEYVSAKNWQDHTKTDQDITKIERVVFWQKHTVGNFKQNMYNDATTIQA